MRRILAETGSPQVTPVTQNIGSLPNLRAAIERLETSTPSTGGGGGAAFALDCSPGEMLVGVGGHAGWYIDQVRAICTNGAGDEIYSGTRGGDGGTPFESRCDGGHGVTGIVGFAGDVVDSFRLECRNAPAGAPENDISLTSSAGGSGGQAFGPFRCGDGEIAVGLRGRFGDVIDNLQLDCAGVVLDTRAAPGWISPAAGGSGGAHFETPCDSGEVMVGIEVLSGDWVDHLNARCVQTAADGSWTRSPSGVRITGGNGAIVANDATQDCPPNSAIFEIAG